jgi:hypothetical protein
MSLQDLIWVAWIGMLCWMAWGTWAVHRSISLNIDPKYSAFIGFWFAIIAVMGLPTFWLLNVVFPEHWSSLGEGIAVVAAGIGSLWLINRINKLRLSPLKLEFYTSRFRPKEISDCLAALEQVRPLFSKVRPADSVLLNADLVLTRVESAVVSLAWRKKLIELTKSERNVPRDVILSLVVQESKSLLETGQYHIWRGALNEEGFGIKATFDIALDELVKSGAIDDAGAKKQRAEVANAIASVG